MKMQLYSQDGKKIKELNFKPNFEARASNNTLANYINYIRSSRRNPIADTLNRGQVSGGGKKPWRQKGTGRARVGSSRSPLWVHGGVTFGPTKDRNFSLKMNQKTRNLAKSTILNEFFKADKVKVVDKIEIKQLKTTEAEKIIENLELDGKISFFLASSELDLAQAFRNLPYVVLNSKDNADILNLISSNWLLLTEKSLKEIFSLETPSLKSTKNETKVILPNP